MANPKQKVLKKHFCRFCVIKMVHPKVMDSRLHISFFPSNLLRKISDTEKLKQQYNECPYADHLGPAAVNTVPCLGLSLYMYFVCMLNNLEVAVACTFLSNFSLHILKLRTLFYKTTMLLTCLGKLTIIP